MSMNLHLKINGKEIDLFQTPTHITYMCTMTNSGVPAFKLTGKKAHRAIYCYTEYVSSFSSTDHIHHILAMMETAKKIEVYVM